MVLYSTCIFVYNGLDTATADERDTGPVVVR